MITATISVKPYVKHFLVLNYGSPVNLSQNPDLYSLFRNCLKRQWKTRDRVYKYKCNIAETYSKTIEIIISKDDFYRYGWELTVTDMVSFGIKVENQAKQFMRSIVSAYEIAMTQKKAILMFQEKFGFSEDVWSYESIKKDYYRSKASYRASVYDIMAQKISEKINGKIVLNGDIFTANSVAP